MKRAVLMIAIAAWAMTLSGCQSCKKLFGLDRRCDSPPPQQFSGQPVNYAPPGACETPMVSSCPPR